MNKIAILLSALLLVSCNIKNNNNIYTKTYESCKVIKLERKQDFTNFIWTNNIVFVSGNDTISGTMTSKEAIKLHKHLRDNHGDYVTLKIENNKIRF